MRRLALVLPVAFLVAFPTAPRAAAHPAYGIAAHDGAISHLDWEHRRLLRRNPDGSVTTVADLGALTRVHPHAFAFDPDGVLHVAESYGPRIWRVDGEGRPTEIHPAGGPDLLGGDALNIAFGPRGRLHVVVRATRTDARGAVRVLRVRVLRLPGDGGEPDVLLDRAGDHPDCPQLYGGDLAVARDGTVYLAAPHRILRLGEPGELETVAGSTAEGHADGRGAEARFAYPHGLALLPGGDLVVVTMAGLRVRRVTPEGEVTTLAGTGERGGRDGPGGQATFDQPYAAAIRGDGSIVVAEAPDGSGAQRFRVIAADGTVRTLPR